MYEGADIGKRKIQGTRGCELLGSFSPMNRTVAEGYGRPKKPAAVSVLDEVRRLKEAADVSHAASREFMSAVKNIERGGGFGLHGGPEMIEKLEPITHGATELNLSFTATVDELLRCIIKFITTEESKVNLQGTRITLRGVIDLAKNLPESSVQILQLGERPMDLSLLRRNCTFPEPDLLLEKKGYSQFESAVIGTLLDSDPTLENLDISGNSLCGKSGRVLGGFSVLAEAFNHRKCNLISLRLSNVQLRSDSLAMISAFIPIAPTLKRIDLSHNKVAFVGNEQRSEVGIETFCTAVRKSKRLEDINLRDNGLDYSSITSIAGLLQSNGIIAKIDLSENPFSCVGITMLAKSLRTNSGLKATLLRDTQLGRKGCSALGKCFQKYNFVMTSLDISDNKELDRAALNPIVKALKNNPTITELYITEAEKYKAEWRHARDLVEANKIFQAAAQNIGMYNYASMSEFQFTNFLHKLSFIKQDEMEHLLASKSFGEVTLTENHVSALRYFSNAGKMRITANLLRVLGTPERKERIRQMELRWEELEEQNLWYEDLI